MVQSITPFIWYENGAEEAAKLYCDIFPDSKILDTKRYPDGAPEIGGSVMSVDIELKGRNYILFNGGPHFKANESFSLFILCESQDEVDQIWESLVSDGGEESRCGWCKDKWGISWQVIPTMLWEMMNDPDAEKSSRVMQAMMQMGKIECKLLQDAYDNK